MLVTDQSWDILYREHSEQSASGVNTIDIPFIGGKQYGHIEKGSLEIGIDCPGEITYGVVRGAKYFKFGSIGGYKVGKIIPISLDLALQPKMKFRIVIPDIGGNYLINICLFGYGQRSCLI